MRTVVFYSPYFGENTLRYVYALRKFPNIEIIGLGQDSYENVEKAGCFDHFVKVENAFNQVELEQALHQILQNRKIYRIFNIQESLQLLIARLREKYNIEGVRFTTALKFRDKALMKQIFKKNAILCANYQKAESNEEAFDFAERNEFPIILKPLKGVSSKSTFLVVSKKDLEKTLEEFKISESEPAILEEFIDGEEGSFDTLTLNGEIKFQSITHYVPPLLHVIRNPWMQLICAFDKNLNDPKYNDIRKTGKKVIKALGLQTEMTHMEWFRRKSDGKIYVGEIAARAPGGPTIDLHNFGHNIDLYYEWANVMLEGNYTLGTPEPKFSVAGACLRSQGIGTHITEITGVDLIKEKMGHLMCGLELPEIGAKRVIGYGGEGLLYVRGEDYQEMLKAATFACENIRFNS
ncbi:MAG: ATP-grasp domain-containing protein [Calditrichaeota bacterium]|nr:MAG: ATP-grasp domain-containing protein [Calditrichota bacterium]